MQKIIYVYDNSLKEVNNLLNQGWSIISVDPVPIAQGNYKYIAAYVVLEKEVNTNKPKTIDPYAPFKEFYNPEVMV